MSDSNPKRDNQQPKERLLDAAEELFAAKGYSEVSVRELATTAGMNVAAVNYHFQGKENLFNEVITRRFAVQRDRTLNGLNELLNQTEGRPKIEDVIRVLVSEYMDAALSNSFLTLITRDMHSGEGGTHFQCLKQMIAPVFKAISQALMAARPSLRQDDLNWIIASIIGQIHHLILRRIKCDSCTDIPEAQAIMFKTFPALALDQAEYIRQTTDHITRFSTAAIDGLYPEEN